MDLEERLVKVSSLFSGVTTSVLDYLRKNPNLTEALLIGYEKAKEQFKDDFDKSILQLGYLRLDIPVPHLYVTFWMRKELKNTKKVRTEFNEWWMKNSTQEIRAGMTIDYMTVEIMPVTR